MSKRCCQEMQLSHRVSLDILCLICLLRDRTFKTTSTTGNVHHSMPIKYASLKFLGLRCCNPHWSTFTDIRLMESSEFRKGSDSLSDSTVQSDQLVLATSGMDQWIHIKADFIGLLHWFPIATNQITQLNQTMNLNLKILLYHTMIRLQTMLGESHACLKSDWWRTGKSMSDFKNHHNLSYQKVAEDTQQNKASHLFRHNPPNTSHPYPFLWKTLLSFCLFLWQCH